MHTHTHRHISKVSDHHEGEWVSSLTESFDVVFETIFNKEIFPGL